MPNKYTLSNDGIKCDGLHMSLEEIFLHLRRNSDEPQSVRQDDIDYALKGLSAQHPHADWVIRRLWDYVGPVADMRPFVVMDALRNVRAEMRNYAYIPPCKAKVAEWIATLNNIIGEK